jgi:hypothetical protein
VTDTPAPALRQQEPKHYRLLATAILFIGLVALSDLVHITQQWTAYGFALQAFYALGLFTAAVLVAIGFTGLIKGLTRIKAILAAGGFLLVGMSQIVGVLSNVLPCGGPT